MRYRRSLNGRLNQIEKIFADLARTQRPPRYFHGVQFEGGPVYFRGETGDDVVNIYDEAQAIEMGLPIIDPDDIEPPDQLIVINWTSKWRNL